MLKKLMLLFICVSLLTLVACGVEGNLPGFNGNQQQTHRIVNDEIQEGITDFFGILIEIVDDEVVDDLTNYIIVDYADIRSGFITEGLTLVFSFDEQVFDFTIIATDMTVDGAIVATDFLSYVGDLSPDDTFVLTHYHTQGTIPRSGFYFIDNDGVENWFTLSQSQLDGQIYWHQFHWSLDYGFYDNTATVATEAVNEVVDLEIDLEFTFYLDRISDEEVESLENYVLFDYSQDVDDLDFGMNIIFNFNQSVTDFAVIGVGNDESDSSLTVVKTAVLFEVGDLTTEKPLVLTRYRTTGTLPVSGFTFVNPRGEEEWFVFQEQIDGRLVWRPFHWKSDYGLAVWEHDYHEVEAGDSLSSISLKYETMQEFLQLLNDLGDSTDLEIGQILKLPSGRWVTNQN